MWFHVNNFLKRIHMAEKLQFKIRLDEPLHKQIKDAADKSGRSVNAEIVHRLDLSFISTQAEVELINAEQAKKLAQQSIEDGYAIALSNCIKAIDEAAKQGQTWTHADAGFEFWDDGDDIDTKVIQPVKAKLEELGFKVEIQDVGFDISF